MKIFLVDDSEPVLKRLVDLLSTVPGAQVAGTAQDADRAVQEILESRPDAVVLDLNLGERSGFDVLRQVRKSAPEILFYMLSNFASEPYRRYARQLGAADFFDKSHEFQRVREVLAARAAA